MNGKGAYVLVAEPDKAVADALVRIVGDVTSLPCKIARDGNQGHEILVSDGPPAILLTDLVLPKRDGFSLVRGLRRADKTRRTKVVAFSAFPAVRKSAQELHGELAPIEVLPKPLAPAPLERALRSAMIVTPITSPSAVPGTAPPATGPSNVTISALPPPPRVPIPTEQERLARIQDLGVVDDAPPDQELQRIVTEVAASFGVPTALVTVVLENEQWFKAYVGLEGELRTKRGGPRSWAFCHHVVEGRDALVVPDAREHPVFASFPSVRDGTVRGYAGAPIVTPQGEVLGSLCIIDAKPLDVGAEDLARLRLVARRVAGELMLGAARRKKQRVPNASEAPIAAAGGAERVAALRALDAAAETMPLGVIVFDAAGRVLSLNAAFAALFDVPRADAMGLRREVLFKRISSSFADPAAAIDRLSSPNDGAFVLSEDVLLAGEDRRLVRFSAAPVEIPGGFVQIVSVS